ncbi:hypothetical protein MO867_21050 [Microbulbifer sp. OS29]|uniref:Uncharacterized protein n=1 Tax=Microbulbifer okhotskensis TaxID=2926617 RepID=A0A9X2ES61_9GAMM|nr:hypothetical protein [Microbulbifer okhotskensis]MCO1336819.1 hypothetical protein [Microbulbifer okhotskensis]
MANNEKVKRLAEAKQKKGWAQKEIEEFAKRRSRELKEISKGIEGDYLASGTQKSIEEVCQDDDKDN